MAMCTIGCSVPAVKGRPGACAALWNRHADPQPGESHASPPSWRAAYGAGLLLAFLTGMLLARLSISD